MITNVGGGEANRWVAGGLGARGPIALGVQPDVQAGSGAGRRGDSTHVGGAGRGQCRGRDQGGGAGKRPGTGGQ